MHCGTQSLVVINKYYQCFLTSWCTCKVSGCLGQSITRSFLTELLIRSEHGISLGSRLVYLTPGSIAWFLFAAKVPGLIESLLTVNHARGVYYTKGSVYMAVFGTVFNSMMRFIVEPVLLWKIIRATFELATPLDILFGIGSIGLVGIHLVFSVRAIKGLPKLISKFNAVQEKANKNE